MDCVVEPDVVTFAERVVPFLSRQPVQHSVILTLLEARLRGGAVDPNPPVCGHVTDAGEVVGVALRTPPRKVVLSVMPTGAVVALEAALCYGAAVTAACSAHALAHGATAAMLYTDLANPTSNSIYQQIGYRPVSDASDFHLR
ncbi:MAG TPA: hypothetical protein VIS06_21695 [Mycobacteriales bacterium]